MRFGVACIVVICSVFSSGVSAFAGCLTARTVYEDDYGWAIMPFDNACDESVSVSVCVKSWPAGSEEAVYNSYSGVVPAHDRLDMTDGKYSTFDSYRWTEDGYQSCPW